MKTFRQMIKDKGTVWAAGAYDALTAKLIQDAGFVQTRVEPMLGGLVAIHSGWKI